MKVSPPSLETIPNNFSPNKLVYKNREINLKFPINPINIPILFSPAILKKVLDINSYKQHLKNFLPKGLHYLLDSPQEFSDLILHQKTKFYTPIENFMNLYNHNFFTEDFQKNIPFFESININSYAEKKENILNQLIFMEKNKDFPLKSNCSFNMNFSNSVTFNNGKIVFDIRDNLASSGYTSLDSENENEKSKKTPQNSDDLLLNIKKPHKTQESISSDEYDSFIDRKILLSDRFKNLKKNKIQITIKQRTQEEIEDYRKQEEERYKHPKSPWEYKLSNGEVAIVAPMSTSSKTVLCKARDHKLLKANRPSYLNLLSLVRDAAAKLPDGVGTRLDICDLVKDSQYINKGVPDDQINSVVSGALDRLHYQSDPCVKFDTHNKLWIYLHRNRTLEYQGWKKKEGEDINIEEDESIKDGKEKSPKKGKELKEMDGKKKYRKNTEKKKEKKKEKEGEEKEEKEESEKEEKKGMLNKKRKLK